MSPRMASANTAVGALPLPLRWVIVPALGFAAFAAAAAFLRHRAQRLSLGPMSNEWLRSNAADAGRHSEH